uniref:Uncharacterized protein n=1 Tax=Mola mola TaxID=94237 RepID=A0A3Q3X3D4_MOLML
MQDIGPIGPDRNWKGIGISLLVILVVLSLIGLSIVLLSKDDGGKHSGSPLTLDDLFERSFQIHDPDAKWISGTYVSNLNSNTAKLMLNLFLLKGFMASKFAVSPDLNFVLLGYDVNCHLFNCSCIREVKELNPPEVSDSVLQFASWGAQGQQLVKLFSNLNNQPKQESTSHFLFHSRSPGLRLSDVSPLGFPEEVLHTQVAHWWSPEGTKLAYLAINDTLVPNMLLPQFTGSLYPRGKQYPYPKMGQINPTVRLYVVTLDGSSRTTELRPPDSFEKSEYYVTMVKWVTPERLSVRWVNRAQNTSILSLCNVTIGDCTKKHVMTSEKWLDRQNEEPLFSKDCTKFFITVTLKHSGSGTFNHITMISNQGSVRHLTSGNWEVSQLLAYDDSTNSVYFLSTEEGPTQQHLYRVSTVDPFHKECLSCSLFKPKCSYYDSTLSPNLRHALLNCRGNISHIIRKTLEKNSVLRQALMNRTTPKWERRTVQINNFGMTLSSFLSLTIIDSAPGGQAVSDRFSLGWDSVLVSSDGVIVARLDGRGSGLQGQRVLHEVHQRLGTVDVQDQITALQHLLRLPYIDVNKVGVYGKAYGGFLSSLLLLSHGSMFRCGIAAAPVTNWRLYAGVCRFREPQKSSPDVKMSLYKRGMTFKNPSPKDFEKNMRFSGPDDTQLKLTLYSMCRLEIFPDEGHDIVSARSQHYMLNSVLTFFRRCFEDEQTAAPETSKEDD